MTPPDRAHRIAVDLLTLSFAARSVIVAAGTGELTAEQGQNAWDTAQAILAAVEPVVGTRWSPTGAFAAWRRRLYAVGDQAVTRNPNCQMEDGVCVTAWHRHALDDAVTDARRQGRCTVTLTDPNGRFVGVCGGELDGHGHCNDAGHHIRHTGHYDGGSR